MRGKRKTSVYVLDDERALPLWPIGWQLWNGRQALGNHSVLVVNAEALIGGQRNRSACGGIHELLRILADPTQELAGIAVVALQPWEELQKGWEILRQTDLVAFRQWPLSWEALNGLASEAKQLSTDRASEWRRLRETAFEIAIFSVLRPLYHGGHLDVVNKGAGAMRFAIQATRQGFYDVGQLANLLSTDSWWVEISKVLDQVELRFADASEAGFASGNRVRQIVATMTGALKRVSEFAATLPATPSAREMERLASTSEFMAALSATEASLDALMQGLDDLQRERTVRRREFLDVRPEASYSLRG